MMPDETSVQPNLLYYNMGHMVRVMTHFRLPPGFHSIHVPVMFVLAEGGGRGVRGGEQYLYLLIVPLGETTTTRIPPPPQHHNVFIIKKIKWNQR